MAPPKHCWLSTVTFSGWGRWGRGESSQAVNLRKGLGRDKENRNHRKERNQGKGWGKDCAMERNRGSWHLNRNVTAREATVTHHSSRQVSSLQGVCHPLPWNTPVFQEARQPPAIDGLGDH